MKFEDKEQIVKTIRFDKDLCQKVESMAKSSERDFSAQIRFMVREYIKMRESV